MAAVAMATPCNERYTDGLKEHGYFLQGELRRPFVTQTIRASAFQACRAASCFIKNAASRHGAALARAVRLQ